MTAIKGLKGEKILIQIGDGASPEVFAHDCLINADREIAFSSDSSEETLPDCDDPSSPGWKYVTKDGLSLEITGSGKLHTASVEAWFNWFKSDNGKNVKALIDTTGANGGGYFGGSLKLTDFKITGQRKQYSTVSVTLKSDGAITWTDAA